MYTTQDQLENICNKAYQYYLNLFGKYIVHPRSIKIVMNTQLQFPSDEDKVPACTNAVNDEGYIINFNIPILLTKFQSHIELICWHEVAHVVCDEIYRCNPWIKQNKDVNGGHPVLFFKVINSWKDKSLSDKLLQRERHDIPYNNGLSDGFYNGYNPLDEVKDQSTTFSYRINKLFN